MSRFLQCTKSSFQLLLQYLPFLPGRKPVTWRKLLQTEMDSLELTLKSFDLPRDLTLHACGACGKSGKPQRPLLLYLEDGIIILPHMLTRWHNDMYESAPDIGNFNQFSCAFFFIPSLLSFARICIFRCANKVHVIVLPQRLWGLQWRWWKIASTKVHDARSLGSMSVRTTVVVRCGRKNMGPYLVPGVSAYQALNMCWIMPSPVLWIPVSMQQGNVEK